MGGRVTCVTCVCVRPVAKSKTSPNNANTWDANRTALPGAAVSPPDALPFPIALRADLPLPGCGCGAENSFRPFAGGNIEQCSARSQSRQTKQPSHPIGTCGIIVDSSTRPRLRDTAPSLTSSLGLGLGLGLGRGLGLGLAQPSGGRTRPCSAVVVATVSRLSLGLSFRSAL